MIQIFEILEILCCWAAAGCNTTLTTTSDIYSTKWGYKTDIFEVKARFEAKSQPEGCVLKARKLFRRTQHKKGSSIKTKCEYLFIGWSYALITYLESNRSFSVARMHDGNWLYPSCLPFSPGKEWKNIFIVYSLFSLSHPPIPTPSTSTAVCENVNHPNNIAYTQGISHWRRRWWCQQKKRIDGAGSTEKQLFQTSTEKEKFVMWDRGRKEGNEGNLKISQFHVP